MGDWEREDEFSSYARLSFLCLSVRRKSNAFYWSRVSLGVCLIGSRLRISKITFVFLCQRHVLTLRGFSSSVKPPGRLFTYHNKMTSATMSLSIEQILRAAQLLEQQQQMSLIDPMSFCKLGRKSTLQFFSNFSNYFNFQSFTLFQSFILFQIFLENYENRMMQTKMRGVDITSTSASLGLPNSTGSSLRSSPFCSQNSSSPNSPQNGQLLPSNMRGNAKLSTASSVAPLLTGRSSNATTSSSSTSVSQSTRQSR